MTDNITLPRAVVWRLHAAFRDADKTIRPNGEKSDYSAEIAALDAALAEPSLTVSVDPTAFTASAFSQTAVLEQAEAFETAYQTKSAALVAAAKPEPATVEQIDEEYIGPVIDARWHDFEAGFRAAERFHGIGGSK
jgi:hypothetical protein